MQQQHQEHLIMVKNKIKNEKKKTRKKLFIFGHKSVCYQLYKSPSGMNSHGAPPFGVIVSFFFPCLDQNNPNPTLSGFNLSAFYSLMDNLIGNFKRY